MKLMQEKEDQEVTIVGELEKECLCNHEGPHSPLILKFRPTLPHEACSLPLFIEPFSLFAQWLGMRYLLLNLIWNNPISDRTKIIQVFY